MYKTAIKKPVFALYTGLIASGYDLAEKRSQDQVTTIVDDIRKTAWNVDAVRYFAQARLDGPVVNPYWPRVAMLLHASFYLDPSDFGPVLDNIVNFPVEAGKKGQDTIDWLKQYPAMLSLIVKDSAFALLWERFSHAMSSERLKPFQEAAGQAVESLVRVLGALESDIPNLVVVPNPLQAPQVADFVRKAGTVYAVISSPRALSIVHELLHSVLENSIADAREAILRHRSLFTPAVVTKMVEMQYAWGGDDASWLRVFEESLVRAASSWVGQKAGLLDAAKVIEDDVRQGFVYVPFIANTFRSKWEGLGSARSFIEECLRDCKEHFSEVYSRLETDLE